MFDKPGSFQSHKSASYFKSVIFLMLATISKRKNLQLWFITRRNQSKSYRELTHGRLTLKFSSHDSKTHPTVTKSPNIKEVSWLTSIYFFDASLVEFY